MAPGTHTVQVMALGAGGAVPIGGAHTVVNQPRADIQGYLGSANYGYAVLLPTLTPASHTLQVYVLDVPSQTPVLVAMRTING